MVADNPDFPIPALKARSLESDRYGLDQHTPGAKLDAGKTMMSLVLMDMNLALERVAAVATYGAGKYTKGGWLQVPDGVARYTDAMFRHLLKEPNETLDPDTGIEHAAHAAWGALARLQLMLAEKQAAKPKMKEVK